MSSSETIKKIEKALHARFQPSFLKVKDESARHVGHTGAQSGKGHFQVEIHSIEFEGKSLIEQHRMVNEALSDLLKTEIHALQLKTKIE